MYALILEVGGQITVTLFSSLQLAQSAEDDFCASHFETDTGEVSSDVSAVSIDENDPTSQIPRNGFAYYFVHEWEGGFEIALYPTREARDKAERAFESKDEDGLSIYLIGKGVSLIPSTGSS